MMIEIRDLHKRFGRTPVLAGATCRIERGQSVALWGPNGAGKTTLLRCILGLLDFKGEVHVGGLDVRRFGKHVRRHIGYVPQEMAFYDDYHVHETVRLIGRLRGAAASDMAACLHGVGLHEERRKYVRQLSGGMKQRLALGLAMLNDPPVLALDEPTSNLDSDARRGLLDQLLQLKRAGKTILFISHRPEEVIGLADRVLTLEHGRIVADQEAAAFASPHEGTYGAAPAADTVSRSRQTSTGAADQPRSNAFGGGHIPATALRSFEADP
jgi:ABC-type multidrug transport system ATPase subunit